ncbi:hypothetical protein THAOC_22746, partial [Thalassiosira oceanica]
TTSTHHRHGPTDRPNKRTSRCRRPVLVSSSRGWGYIYIYIYIYIYN